MAVVTPCYMWRKLNFISEIVRADNLSHLAFIQHFLPSFTIFITPIFSVALLICICILADGRIGHNFSTKTVESCQDAVSFNRKLLS